MKALRACLSVEDYKLGNKHLASWARDNLMSKGDSILTSTKFLSQLATVPASQPKSAVLYNTKYYPYVWLWVIYRNLRQVLFLLEDTCN